jgi:hypothetical protein
MKKQTIKNYQDAITSSEYASLIAKGAEDVSTALQQKHGTIALRFKNGRIIEVTLAGYCRTGTVYSFNRRSHMEYFLRGHSFFTYPIHRIKASPSGVNTYASHLEFLNRRFDAKAPLFTGRYA